MRYDIGIVGAGTAGCASGILLARAGHRVTLYERTAQPGPVGAGVTIQPSGRRVLEHLGVWGNIRAAGAPIDSLRCRTTAGKTVFSLNYPGGERTGLGLHRGVLFEELFSDLSESSAKIQLGIEIHSTHAVRHGRVLVDQAGERHGPHELILICDGARSTLRGDPELHERVSTYPWGCLWYALADPSRVAGSTLRQVVKSNTMMLGLLPTGFGPGGHVPLASLFWSIRGDNVPAFRELVPARFSAWKERCVRHIPELAGLIEQIRTPADLIFAQYRDVDMYPWHGPRIAYLGDAAHAMSPQLGQGCNLALVDAMTLVEELRANEPLSIVLDRYSRRRRAHLEFYQFATRWMTPFFQGDAPFFGAARDFGMPLLCKFPAARRLMVSAMCGELCGFLKPFDLRSLRDG